jgi:hypothetical protein
MTTIRKSKHPMVQRWDNLEEAARDCYEAYGESTRWKNHQGNTMPMWADLPQAIKAAWMAVVRRILSKAYRIVAHDLIEHIQNDCDKNCAQLTKGAS